MSTKPSSQSSQSSQSPFYKSSQPIWILSYSNSKEYNAFGIRQDISKNINIGSPIKKQFLKV
jgi:hypothetical protein